MSLPPLRIFHLNTSHSWRGGEVQTLLLARGLGERGHSCVIVGQPGSELLERSAKEDLPTIAVSMKGEWDLRAVAALRNRIRRLEPNIVHAHTAHACTLGLLARRRKDDCLVYSRRVSFPSKKNPFSKWKSRSPDAILAVSDFIRKELIRNGLPEEKVFLVHSATDFERMDQAQPGSRTRREWNIPEDALVIGNVSHFDPAKRQDLLIRAFLDLASKPLPQKPYLLLIGGGPHLDFCRSLAAASPVPEQVIFAGHRSDPENFYSAMDLFAFPSAMHEGLPGVLREAMGTALAVVAFRQPATEEMVKHGETGILASDDPSEWVIAMEQLLRNSELRVALGEKARSFARQFTVENLVTKTEACYYRTLEVIRHRR